MAVSNVALYGAAILTPVFVGRITKSMGWQWSFYFVAIFLGVSLPFMVLFVPETAYRRPNCFNTDFKHLESLINPESPCQTVVTGLENEPKGFVPATMNTTLASTTEISAPALAQKHSFLESLKPFNGRKTNESFLKLLVRPFPLFFHPGILWVSFSLAP